MTDGYREQTSTSLWYPSAEMKRLKPKKGKGEKKEIKRHTIQSF